MKNSKLKTQNSKPIALIVVFLALASLYSVVIPLGEGPDEPGHAGYVFFLAGAGQLPDQRRGDVPGEGHQPPLAYALAAPLLAWLPREQRAFDLPGNPRFTWAGGSELNAVAHGSREYWPWRGGVAAWHLARLVSVGLGAATVALTYATAQALVDGRRRTDDGAYASFVLRPRSFVPLLAAALLAFNPQFLFVSALVTNDALLTTLSAALLWLALRGASGPRDRGSVRWRSTHALALGVVLGLALLAKQSALLLAPIALGSVIQAHMPAEGARRRQLIGALAGCLLCIAAALLICGWWHGRNLRLYGDLFGLAIFQAEFATQAFDARSPAAWLAALAQLHDSFWARFGWMNLPAPRWLIWFFIALELAALIGLARWLVENMRVRTKDDGRGTENQDLPKLGRLTTMLVSSFVVRLWSTPGVWLLLALPLLAFAWVASFALTAGLVAWQGRLLFPALPAIAIGLAIGIAKVKGKRQSAEGWHIRTFYLLLFTLFLIALWLPFGVVRPAYPFETLPEQVARAQLGTPAYGRFGKAGERGAELLGWRLEQPLQPGSAAELALTWHALGRQNRDWTVFVHLVDANEQIVAEDNRQPRSGAFPMTQWVAGDWVADRHTLALPVGLPAGVYTLRIGLYDADTQERAGVYNQSGKLVGDYLPIGQVTIR